MAVKKKARHSRSKTVSLQKELALARTALNDRKLFVDLESKCLDIEDKYLTLRTKVINLLSPDQIEAARICGCAPEVYALEWIEILKKDIRELVPSYARFKPLSVLSLQELENGTR